jgi:poly-gamma-glutamate synthesis protein (capsule biosynthesis protein)
MVLAGCQLAGPALPVFEPQAAQPAGQPGQATRTPFQPLPPDTPTPTPDPKINLWIDPGLPAELMAHISPGDEFEIITQPDQPGTDVVVTAGAQPAFSTWVYALAAPFPTRLEAVSLEDVRRFWRGEANGPFGGSSFLMDENTQAVFRTLWGAPSNPSIQLVAADALVQQAWGLKAAYALLPFEALDPRMKVLAVDGQSPLQKGFSSDTYGLAVPIGLQGDSFLVESIFSRFGPHSIAPLLPPGNRDPAKLTVVAMTGVTALVRATAFTMEQKGITYPARDIRDWLQNADITHISNEVPFAEDCPYPNPVQEGVRFCSASRYIGLLEDVGTDVVELTGDHFQDWGVAAMNYTLELYKERGWQYYGGGANLEEGRRPLLIEHNGNRLAFIGCNGKGGSFAQASNSHPGAVVCDYAWMQAEITRLRGEGYLPIATFQHFEYYTYQAQPNQKKDFQGVAQAGAVIVSGSQAHQPQAMEFAGEAFIHYGLGNLFFDQYDISLATRQAFIDRHVFYNGRYIGTELLPILFVDYARPRPMTPAEQDELYRAVFAASGW